MFSLHCCILDYTKYMHIDILHDHSLILVHLWHQCLYYISIYTILYQSEQQQTYWNDCMKVNSNMPTEKPITHKLYVSLEIVGNKRVIEKSYDKFMQRNIHVLEYFSHFGKRMNEHQMYGVTNKSSVIDTRLPNQLGCSWTRSSLFRSIRIYVSC